MLLYIHDKSDYVTGREKEEAVEGRRGGAVTALDNKQIPGSEFHRGVWGRTFQSLLLRFVHP